jgi:hypothetical protein
MKQSEVHVAQGELAKSQPCVGEKLEAPVRLTVEQLETVAAGFMAQLSREGGSGSTATTGLYPVNPPTKMF